MRLRIFHVRILDVRILDVRVLDVRILDFLHKKALNVYKYTAGAINNFLIILKKNNEQETKKQNY